MEIIELELDKIIPYARNPRNNNIAVDKVAASIKEYGFRQPIVVDEGNVIIVGHTRFLAARRLGLKKVPVHIATGLNEHQIKAYRIADNKTGEYAEWDDELLGIELKELQESDFNLDLTGFEDDELSGLLDGIEINDSDFSKEDDVPAIQEQTITKHGDIWLLGDHKLICGDSTNQADFVSLMGSRKADMIFTDPPYNVNYEGKTKDAMTIKNDNMNSSKFFEFLNTAFANISAYSKKGAGYYVCHADSEGVNFRNALIENDFLFKQCIIWVKNTQVISRQDYHWQHEPILYGWKKGGPHKWYADRKQTTIWEYDKPQRSDLHPTMKPVSLVQNGIKNSSKRGDLILDPFLGAGSTLIAAERMDRICYGIELSEAYCDVIIRRYRDYTQTEPIHEATGKKLYELEEKILAAN